MTIPLDQPRIVPGQHRACANAVGKPHQLGQPEAAVAANARIRRRPLGISGDKRLDHGQPERLAQVERHVRHPQRVARRPGCPHRVGRAAGAARIRRRGINPQPQRHADRVEPLLDGLQEGHGAVDTPAHRNDGATGDRWQRAVDQRTGERDMQRVRRQREALLVPGLRLQRLLEVALADAGRVEHLTTLRQFADQSCRSGRVDAGVGPVPRLHHPSISHRQLDLQPIAAAVGARHANPAGGITRAGSLCAQRVTDDGLAGHGRKPSDRPGRAAARRHAGGRPPRAAPRRTPRSRQPSCRVRGKP